MSAIHEQKRGTKAMVGGLTSTQVFVKISEDVHLKLDKVKAVIGVYMDLAISKLKKHGSFKVGGVLDAFGCTTAWSAYATNLLALHEVQQISTGES